MNDLYWLSDEQMAKLSPFFPKSHGKPRVDDRRVPSGIIFVNRNGLRWRDAPAAYGPHKRSTCSSPQGRLAITSARGRRSAASQRSTGCSGIVVMMPTGSGMH